MGAGMDIEVLILGHKSLFRDPVDDYLYATGHIHRGSNPNICESYQTFVYSSLAIKWYIVTFLRLKVILFLKNLFFAIFRLSL